MTSMNFKCLCGWSWHHNCPVTWPTVPTSATQPDRTELHHLLNRAIDGVVLHGESDRLRELVRGLEQRAEQAEAAVVRVRAELDRLAALDTVRNDDGRADRFGTGARWTIRMIRENALDEQPTTAPVHLAKGTNAEDCPACKGTNPPYPFLCPGPEQSSTTITA